MRTLIFCLIVTIALTNCHSSKKAFQESQTHQMTVTWPGEYNPETSVFFVHNHIDIKASPEIVWQVLKDAKSWSEYYDGASEVVFEKSGKRPAGAGYRFLFGIPWDLISSQPLWSSHHLSDWHGSRTGKT